MRPAEQICNLALTRVGQRQLIDSIDEPSTPAQLCKALYPVARDSLLARYPWPFATKHQVLALLDYTRSGWTYAYAVPTDMVAPQYLFAGARPGALALSGIAAVDPNFGSTVTSVAFLPAINGSVPLVAYALELGNDGTKPILVTDQEDAELVYTSALTVVAAMPQLFQDAVAWQLARELALALPDKAPLAMGFGQQAEISLQRAWAQVMNSQQSDPQPDSSFITVRG